ncbi:acyl-CoA dehydrogenase family protein [Amycolatopsis rhabdoformis]|uniref:Acyl-CoA dehydrogenase family protein n=1 Tax=Amycolatopsis rhabdoformis TaxID=1448059 RepID=A0ABZ1IFQ3_9PSEU|nr:acyl-CoA dehydrogenase family protein [Amycolatopsis rhabdoformis]WSE32290.1 acyl-CoA dehydrogenase family protein [Amycolatopsis rhabdoformis]
MMESGRTAPETADALMAKVRAAVPVLAAHADATEEGCRVAPESADALREAGAFALTTPREFGGLGADLVSTVRVLSELGRGCPSSAWVAGISAEAKGHFAKLLPDEVRAELYADPHARMCAVGVPGEAVEVPGGVEITGRWSYASGSEDADWAILAAMVAPGDGVPRVVGVLVPVSELSLERTWRVAGLRGTGSHTLVAEGVFVPAVRVLEIPAGPDGAPDITLGEPLSLVAVGVMLAAPLAGAALGALDVVEGVLRKRKPPMTPYEDLAASPSARQVFAEAEHLVNGGHDRLIHLAERIQGMLPGEGIPAAQRSAFRMEIVSVLRQFLRAVDLLMDLHGSSGFSVDNPLQRYWRDLNVGARHLQFTSYLTIENHGLLVTGAGEPILPV